MMTTFRSFGFFCLGPPRGSGQSPSRFFVSLPTSDLRFVDESETKFVGRHERERERRAL